MTFSRLENELPIRWKEARSVVLLLMALLLGVLGCGDDATSPPDDTTPCPDQSYADLNLYAGRLSDLLYPMDVAQLLWAKGATDFFQSEIPTHADRYSSQEVYDVISSASRYVEFADSLRGLLDETVLFADTLDPEHSWAPLFSRWRGMIESRLAWGDTLCALLCSHAEEVALDVAGDPSSPQAVSLSCQAARITTGFQSLESFAAEAGPEEWAPLFPTFTACLFDRWTEGWQEIIERAEAALLAQTEPILGPVGRYHAVEAASVLPSWEEMSAWASGNGTLHIETTALASSGGALLILLPEDAPVKGAYHHPFYLSHSTSLRDLPSGTYRALLFSSHARPFASETFRIRAGETTTLHPTPALLQEEESCSLIGGDVPLWAVDPANEDHISNDYNLSCGTEIWSVRYVYQALVPPAPDYRFRGELDFQITVHCVDRSFQGDAVGSASVFAVEEGSCTLTDFGPDTFAVAFAGVRHPDYIELFIDADSTLHTTVFDCPDSLFSNTVFVPDMPASLFLWEAGHGEVTFPPSRPDLPENSIYIHISTTRIF